MFYLINDHKCGFVMTQTIIRRFNQQNFKNKNNETVKLNMRHMSIMWNENKPEHKYILVVRNPKEIIISGYLYHKKCNQEEKWALTKNYNYYDIWIERNHYDMKLFNNEFYNRSNFSDDKGTYQEKLNKLNQNDGIKFEMNNVAYNTILGLYNFPIDKNVLIVKFEDLIYNLKKTLKEICLFLDIYDVNNHDRLFMKCKSSNILRLKSKGIQNNSHITNFNLDKERWKKYWNDEIEEEFSKLFPKDIMKKLNYIN